MRTTILITVASLMTLLFACTETQITQFSHVDKIKIQNDTNWVEITDIDTVDVCISSHLYGKGKGLLIKSESEYKDWFNKSLEDDLYLHFIQTSQYTNCTEEYQSPAIDFENRDLILYLIITGGGPINTRNIYRNDKTKEVLYLHQVKFTKAGTYERSGFGDRITIPKIPSGYTFRVDTLFIQ